MLVDEESALLKLLAIQFHGELQMYASFDQIACHDLRVTRVLAKPLPSAPSSAHWIAESYHRALFPEEGARSLSRVSLVEIPR